MNILLTGASGFIGSHLLHALQKAGHSITACTHHKRFKKNTQITQCHVDYMKIQNANDWLELLQNIDVVINSVGIIAETNQQSFEQLHHKAPARLFEACEKVGIKTVIQISALGADDSAIVPYHLSKKAADDVLRNMRLRWFILRPSLVYGKGGGSFKLFKRLSNLPIILLFNGGQQQLQPIAIRDVVATVLRCLDDDVHARQTIDVVGKTVVSYQHWMLALREKRSKPLFLSLPIKLMIKVACLGKFINLALFNPDTLRMLEQNSVSDTTKLTAFLGREPLSIEQGIKLEEGLS